MAHNPVQIVLNDTNFIKAPDSGRMGYPKEFFGARDSDFIAHKRNIFSQAMQLKEAVEASSYGPSVYASVKLRDEALAKSYRPTKALFKPEFFPCAGVGKLGEMFYLVNSEYIPNLLNGINSAEETTSIKEGHGRRLFTPSNERSETGAIESIDLLQAEEKINFSLEEAISWFRDSGVAGGYLIELFEMPDNFHQGLGRKELLDSLKKLLTSFGPGTRADFLRPFGKSNLVDFRLTSSSQPAQIRDLRAETYFKDQDVSPLNENFDLHQNALLKIAQHPLIRKISLPPKIILSTTEAVISSQMGGANLTEKSESKAYPKIGVIDTGVGSSLEGWVIHKHDFLEDDNLDKGHGTFIGGLLVEAQNLNNSGVGREEDGCLIYDIPLFPKGSFSSVYQSGFTDFLEEVEQAVSEAKENYGIRIFNLSINATSAVEADEYSYYASRLDEISEKYRAGPTCSDRFAAKLSYKLLVCVMPRMLFFVRSVAGRSPRPEEQKHVYYKPHPAFVH